MEEYIDELSKEYALRELFSFVIMIYTNLLQTGTEIISKLYTYYKYPYLRSAPYHPSKQKRA